MSSATTNVFSDLDHMYNDVIGGGSNGSFRGSPGHDSDIYGNAISHCWDDGLEVEGGNRNVRIWDNYITQCMNMIGNAATSIGPLYIWRNVVTHSQSKPGAGGMHFLKMGYATSEDWMTGHQYIFHNTLFRSDDWPPVGGFGGNRIVKHTVSPQTTSSTSALPTAAAIAMRSRTSTTITTTTSTTARFPPAAKPTGFAVNPSTPKALGFDAATKTGSFQLTPNSPGANAGQTIPNFSDGYTGKAPDVGAHQRGTPPFRYGVHASQP